MKHSYLSHQMHRSSLLLAMVLSCLPACSVTEDKVSTHYPAKIDLGSLVNNEDLDLYKDNKGLTEITSDSSPALVIDTHDSWSRLMLANGKLAWTNTPIEPVQTDISITKPSIDVTSKPFTLIGQEDFQWLELKAQSQVKVLNATTELYSETPEYIKSAGRKLQRPVASHPFNWPQLQLQANSVNGWASINDIKLAVIKDNSQIKLKGLINKPFLTLLHQTDTAPSEKALLFLNLTHTSLASTQSNTTDWRLQQIIYPEMDEEEGIKNLAFYSGDKNSYLFEVIWNDHTKKYFGFHDKTHDIPTPIILDYTTADLDKDGITDIKLHLLQISGDEEKEEWLMISGKHSDKQFAVKPMKGTAYTRK